MSTAKKEKTPADGPARKGVWLAPELHRKLKMRAAQRGLTVQQLVEEYLEWATLEIRAADQAPRKGKTAGGYGGSS